MNNICPIPETKNTMPQPFALIRHSMLFKCVTHWRQVHNSQFILLRLRTKGDQVALIGRHWLRWSGAERLMAVNVKEPSSTAELGPIDSAELVYSIGFHCGVFPFCFSSFLFVLAQKHKGIFCQLNDYGKSGLNGQRMSQQLLGRVFSKDQGMPSFSTILDNSLLFLCIESENYNHLTINGIELFLWKHIYSEQNLCVQFKQLSWLVLNIIITVSDWQLNHKLFKILNHTLIKKIFYFNYNNQSIPYSM